MNIAAGKRVAPVRVLISHQGCVPIYRRGLFDRLGSIPDIEYVVAYGDPPRETDYMVAPPPYTFPSLKIANRELGFAGKHVIWQPLVLRFWREFDAAILGDEVKYLSHTAIIITAKLLRKPIILWGFGYRPDYAEERAAGWLSRLATRLGKSWRGLLLRSADGYLAYTSAGAGHLRSAGMPGERIATVCNTVDVDFQRVLAAEAAAEPKDETRSVLGVPPEVPVLLYFGRFLPSKRVDLLIAYVRHANARGRRVHAVIIGGGTEESALRKQAADVPEVHFFPPCILREDRTLSRALRIAQAVVIPGFVGLAVTHSFAHGVPLITRAGEHPPEIDYLKHGQNGLILPQQQEAFFAGLDAFLDDPILRERLAQGAGNAAAALTIDTMAQAFDTLVRLSLKFNNC
jgi:glycosyltransferase involved in cell wall biosynthesis